MESTFQAISPVCTMNTGVFGIRKIFGVVVLALPFVTYLLYNYIGILAHRASPGAPMYGNSTVGRPVDKVTRTGEMQTGHVTRSMPNATFGQRPPIQEYHKLWEVNCSEIAGGNETLVRELKEKLRWQRPKESLMPSDSTVVSWTGDCSVFREQRGYHTVPTSDEEASFSLAYIILVHKGSAQVERLLRAIYQPQNIYCIHPDSKSPEEFHQAMVGLANCFDNVFIASKLEEVQYAGFTLLLPNINCMRDLTGPLASGYPWRYVMNLCGQDFPLKTNLEIVQQLKVYHGHNLIRSYVPNKKKLKRTQFEFKIQNGNVVPTERRKSPVPHRLKIYSGSAYYAVTRNFVEYILRDPVATDLLNWTRDTHMPEETYWAIMQRVPGAPGGEPEVPKQYNQLNTHYVNWYSARPRTCSDTFVREVCILTIGDLYYLKKQTELFANKFYYEKDPVILQCLENALDFRVRHPETSLTLPGFPVPYSH